MTEMTADRDVEAVTSDLDRRRFRWIFAGIVAFAAIWRVAYVLIFKRDDIPVGDEIYYSAQALTIFHGDGYSYPFPPGGPGANHAPLTAAALAPVSWWYDGSSIVFQRLLMALYGTAVVAGIGLVARRLFDRRVALVATAIAAGYGAFWLNDVVLMSETFATAGVVALLSLTYAYRRTPSTRTAIGLGAVIGLAGLARAELLAFGAILAIVVVVVTTRRGPLGDADQQRFADDSANATHRTAVEARSGVQGVVHLGLAGLCALLVIAPWVIRNQVRFEDSTLISTQDGLTLIGANCDEAYDGPSKGFWVITCIDAAVTLPEGIDQSQASTLYREAAIDYIEDHRSEIPGVMGARVARGLSVWRVEQMAFVNVGEGRSQWGSRIATYQYWLLVPIAILGLRRWPSRSPRWPIIVVFGLTVAMFAVVYGLPRFRVPAEVGIVLAAAVPVADWIGALRGRVRDA